MIHQFYIEHRPEILATVRKIGREEAALAWGIPQGTIHHIITNWGKDETPPVPETVTTCPESDSPGSPVPAAAAPAVTINRSKGNGPEPSVRTGPPGLPALVEALRLSIPWRLEICEEDLAELDDDTYWQVWYRLGQIVRRRANREEVGHD